MPRQNLISQIQEVFRSFGFVPIDTPALEYTEVLLGKGGGETDKQMFRFNDNGGRDVAMRFDLTVPLARFVAANADSLSFPFKRYHIAKVWRGEKPQKGRYREFLQCDFDIIGADNAQSDFEILLLIDTCLRTIGVPSFRIRVSHRGLTSSYLSSLSDNVDADQILRTIDKLPKIGEEKVRELLAESGLTADVVDKVISYISLPSDSFNSTLEKLVSMFGSENEHIRRLTEIRDMAKGCGVLHDFVIDTSITRGLDYYTGIVWETFLTDLPSIGSVCSGGRYNNLTGLYSSKKLPGVGSAIGLDRLIAALEELNSPIVNSNRTSDVMVIADQDPVWAEKTAMNLRKIGLKAECYLGNKAKGAQFAFAQSNGIPYVVCSEDNGVYVVRDLETREMITMTAQELAEKIR
jgi:histidyl-tRNA synthetase